MGFDFSEPEPPVITENTEIETAERVPLYTDPEWSDYVMRQFTTDELDENGNPFIHGLRRVARLLLGPIVSSKAHIVRAPDGVSPTTAEYEVVFLWCLTDDIDGSARQVTFSDAADVWFNNTDPEYLRFPSSTACTRAEARCLRKALRLKTIAAEEGTALPVDNTELVNNSTLTAMKAVAARIGVDIKKCLAKYGKYKTLEELPASVASRMFQRLSELQNHLSEIPDDIKVTK